ncbi:MAG: enoyl-CoA hydratase [Flammeovirgaceae bacterium]|nr:enoyl-CoA hydratase [Flammeovirgaceae bacterium]
MSYKNLKTTLSDGIITIEISREAKLNALNGDTLDELAEIIGTLSQNLEVKAAIITGAGTKAFVAGADISEFQGLNESDAYKFSERGQDVFALIENCHKPIIAVVNGFALGGGCELAMACHIRVASDEAMFGQPEVNLGIIPGYGGTQRLTQLIGKGKSLELMMTGDMIDAHQAFQMGLVNHVAKDKLEALTKARVLLQKIMTKAPFAIGAVIDCANAVFNQNTDGYQVEATAFANAFKTQDFKEGSKAFIEKRKPKFRGT